MPLWQESAISVEHQLVGTSIAGQSTLNRAAAALPCVPEVLSGQPARWPEDLAHHCARQLGS